MSTEYDPCPRPDLLIALDQDVLPGAVSTRIRNHLAGCRICTQLRQDLLASQFTEPALSEISRVRKRVLGEDSGRRSVIYRYGVPAAIAACFVAGVFLWRTSPPASTPATTTVTVAPTLPPAYRLAVEPAPLRLPFAAAIILRGQQEIPSQQYLKDLGSALEPYRAARYAEAAHQLAALGRKFPKAVEPPFYQGVSWLLAGDAAQALGPLEKARTIGGEALNDDIAWYLAAAYERATQWDKAAAMLTALCRTEGVHRNAACEGLKRR